MKWKLLWACNSRKKFLYWYFNLLLTLLISLSYIDSPNTISFKSRLRNVTYMRFLVSMLVWKWMLLRKWMLLLFSNTAWKVTRSGVFFWSVFFYIQCKYRRIRTKKNSVFAHFSRSRKLVGHISRITKQVCLDFMSTFILKKKRTHCSEHITLKLQLCP